MEQQNLQNYNLETNNLKKISKFVKINFVLLILSVVVFYTISTDAQFYLTNTLSLSFLLPSIFVSSVILMFLFSILSLFDIHKNNNKGTIFSWAILSIITMLFLSLLVGKFDSLTLLITIISILILIFTFLLIFKFHKKIWLWVPVILIILPGIIFLVYLFLSINTDKPYEIYGYNLTHSSIAESIYEYKCESKNKLTVTKQTGQNEHDIYCLARSTSANQDCIENNDCDGGYCVLHGATNTLMGISEADKKNIKLDVNGYMIGKCTEANYNYEGGHLNYEGGGTLSKPYTPENYEDINYFMNTSIF